MGKLGVALQRYDRLNLDQFSRRYTIGAGQTLTAALPVSSAGHDYAVHEPGGLFAEYKGE